MRETVYCHTIPPDEDARDFFEVDQPYIVEASVQRRGYYALVDASRDMTMPLLISADLLRKCFCLSQ